MTGLDTTEPALRWPKKRELYRMAAWLFTHLFCGLVPLWASWLLLKLGKQSTDLSDYVSHGEFCLYAAGLAGTTLFVVLREERRPLRGGMAIGLLAGAVLVISATVFAGVFKINYKNGVSTLEDLDIPFLAAISIFLYAFALVIAMTTYYLEELTRPYDPRKAQQKDQEALTAAFHSIQD